MARGKADIILYAVVGLDLMHHIRFASAHCLAMFDKILRSTRQGNGAWTSMSGNKWLFFPHNFLGGHFSSILYLLV